MCSEQIWYLLMLQVTAGSLSLSNSGILQKNLKRKPAKLPLLQWQIHLTWLNSFLLKKRQKPVTAEFLQTEPQRCACLLVQLQMCPQPGAINPTISRTKNPKLAKVLWLTFLLLPASFHLTFFLDKGRSETRRVETSSCFSMQANQQCHLSLVQTQVKNLGTNSST